MTSRNQAALGDDRSDPPGGCEFGLAEPTCRIEPLSASSPAPGRRPTGLAGAECAPVGSVGWGWTPRLGPAVGRAERSTALRSIRTTEGTSQPMNYEDHTKTVTASLVAMIEQGDTGQWVMPWHTHGFADHLRARNATTDAGYRGANVVALAVAGIEWGFPTGEWATYRQWQSVDAQVRKRERATQIVKWIPIGPTSDGVSAPPGPARMDPMAYPMDVASLAELSPIEPGSLRVGVSEDLGGVLVSDTIRRTFRDRVERLSGLVRSCDEVGVDLREAPAVDWALRSDLFVAQFGEQAAQWDEDFNPNIRQSFESALATPMADIAAARHTQMELYQAFQSHFDDYDVLICPGVSVPPFPWTQRNPAEIDGAPVENYMAWLALSSSLTVVGHPVTALPCGLDEHGTPFGIQVVGPIYQDRRLLTIAATLERIFAADPSMARPQPDLDALARQPSSCRQGL